MKSGWRQREADGYAEASDNAKQRLLLFPGSEQAKARKGFAVEKQTESAAHS